MSDRVEWACEFCGEAIADGDGTVFAQDRLHWYSAHNRCATVDAAADYSIPVAELRTESEVIHQTAHLLEAGWLNSTDWHQILLNVTDRKDAPVTSARR